MVREHDAAPPTRIARVAAVTWPIMISGAEHARAAVLWSSASQ
jgi:hypothetical protein